MREAGVTADLGAGWAYFRVEAHFASAECVGQGNTVSGICDGLAVPRQGNRRKLVFLELKTSGKYAKAVDQIRAGVREILAHGIPNDVVLHAEIWHSRTPKATITAHRYISVNERTVFVRHRKSG
jgi:hypothetical protein